MNLDDKTLTRMFELFCLRPFVIFKKYFVPFQTGKRSIRQRCKETRLNSNQNKSTVDCSFFKKSCRKNLFYQIRKKKRNLVLAPVQSSKTAFISVSCFLTAVAPMWKLVYFRIRVTFLIVFFLATIPGFLLPTKNLPSL